jgi:hypothetical protein
MYKWAEEKGLATAEFKMDEDLGVEEHGLYLRIEPLPPQ